MEKNIIAIEIRCTSGECEQIRESGQFFETIADALCIAREDIEEIKSMPKKVFKITDSRCPKCGEGEFITEPNQYDILTVSDGKLQVDHTETIDDFKIFCRECGVEVEG